MVTVTLAGSGASIEDEYRRMSDGIARCKRHDLSFDAGPYEPAAVTAAREMWRVRMRAEYESVPVFVDLARELAEANATLDAQAVVLRMAIDEVRHAEICGQTVRALGGIPESQVSVAPAARAPAGCGPEERALRSVVYGSCMIEVVNTANLVDILDSMTDPYLREATRQLLADEVLHGTFGFEYLSAWGPWLDAHPAVRSSLDGFLPRAFAELERRRSGVTNRKRTLSADEVALGIPAPARLPEVFFQTVEGAIVPGLERLGLDAGPAFRARSLDARARR